MKRILFAMLLLCVTACAAESIEDESQLDIESKSEALTSTYGSLSHNGAGPFAGPVGTEVFQTQAITNNGQAWNPPCDMPLGSCTTSNYYKYYFNPGSPLGYAVTFAVGNPNNSPAGGPALQKRMCFRLKDSLGNVVYDGGCIVLATNSGGTNAFNASPNWGNYLNFVTTKMYYPEFRFGYKFLPNLAAPNGTPCNSCLIPNNSLTMYYRRDQLP